MKEILFLISFLVLQTVSAQRIDRFGIDSGGASATAGGIQITYNIGEVNIAERTSASISVSEGFIVEDFTVLIDPKVFLQGPFLAPIDAGLMNDTLRAAGLLPTTSPYADAATVDASVFSTTGNDAIVDWIWVELRTAADNTNLVNGRSALLQRDGDIVDLDGTSSVLMQAPQTSYYVVIAHRNHMAAMSDAVQPLQKGTGSLVNFTDTGFVTFGNNAQVMLASNDMALWAGDANGLQQVRFSGADNDPNAIKDFVLADPANGFNSVTFTSTGYLNIDLDMNGEGKFSGSGGNDSNVIKDNVLAHPGNGFGSSTYTINNTVPPNNQ